MTKNKSFKNGDKKSLKNLEIHIDEFGNLITSIEQDRINQFLDKNVKDRKLEHLQ